MIYLSFFFGSWFPSLRTETVSRWFQGLFNLCLLLQQIFCNFGISWVDYWKTSEHTGSQSSSPGLAITEETLAVAHHRLQRPFLTVSHASSWQRSNKNTARKLLPATYTHCCFESSACQSTQLVFSSQELLIPRCGLAIASLSRLSEYWIKWVNPKPSLREQQRSVTLLCYPLLSYDKSPISASPNSKRSTSAKFPTSTSNIPSSSGGYKPNQLHPFRSHNIPYFAQSVRDALKTDWDDGNELWNSCSIIVYCITPSHPNQQHSAPNHNLSLILRLKITTFDEPVWQYTMKSLRFRRPSFQSIRKWWQGAMISILANAVIHTGEFSQLLTLSFCLNDFVNLL